MPLDLHRRRLRPAPRIPLIAFAALGLAASACDVLSEASAPTDDTPIVESSPNQMSRAQQPKAIDRARETPEVSARAVPHDDPELEAASASEAVQVVEPPVVDAVPADVVPEPVPEPEPVTARIARQTLTVHVEPSQRAALRGRIPMGEAFPVFAFVDGKGEDSGCGGLGWAEVGAGYVCLERSRKAKGKEPRTLPYMRDRGFLPYFYAKLPPGKTAHKYASVDAYKDGDAPVASLEKGHDYAFIGRKQVRGEVFLFDSRGRVVPEKTVRRFRPSRFEGHDLEAEPVAADELLAWTVRWPNTELRTEPSKRAALAPALDYHRELRLDAEPVDGFYRLTDGSGWVAANDVRRFVAPEAIEDVAAGEIWIDVELEQQVLTVMRGATPIFTTMVSSGFKSPTPQGLFRIRLKQAQGTMNSSPGADDYYAVEHVPHVQYFFGSFALHSAYWHDRFGHKMSHGCVNLSPKDAARVYSLTGPHPQGGWVHVYEAENDPGTTVRVRRGDRPVKDRRKPVEPVFG